MPEERFEAHVAEARQAGEALTTAGVLGLERQLRREARRAERNGQPPIPLPAGEGAGARDVLGGQASWSAEHADALEFLRRLPDRAVDFVMGSPPYPEKGERYGAGSRKWPTEEWVAWMLQVTREAVRACRGDVLWVVSGAVQGGRYLPAAEMLMADWHRRGGACERPAVWDKNAPPNRDNWYCNAWEYVLAFRAAPATEGRYFDWQAVAAPPRYHSGGRFRQRDAKGERRLGGAYPQGELARPRDVVRVPVGGGHLGSALAHENEGPYPEALVAYFLPVLCPADGIACDPFLGSGTTLAVALGCGRRFIGCDVRPDQVDLTRRRLAGATPMLFAGGTA